MPVSELLDDPQTWWRQVVAEDLPRVLEVVDGCVAGRLTNWCVEYRIRRADGQVRWIEDQGTAVPGGEAGADRLIGVAQDITARKQAEEEAQEVERRLRDAQKMESLGVLAGGVAHDFNNLLMGILGNADLAMLELPAGARTRRRLEGIEEAARRAADLARQLLAYSGQGRFLVESLDLRTLVRGMTELLGASIPKKIRLTLELPPDLPNIEADADQIRQVIVNLVTNAAEAIGTAVGYIRIRAGQAEGDVFMEVIDDGAGMDEATCRRVFEPFFTTKFTGRGLGLAAAHGIVRGHGGAITVQSEPGRGTTFRLLFPSVAEPVVVPGPERPGEELSPDQITVMVVDDEAIVRDVAAAMLRYGGHHVIEAADGAAAVKMFEAHAQDVDCVLLDLAMPGMDGLETFRALRAIDPQVRVLLTSGYSAREALNRFSGAPLAGFLQKPYHAKDLLERVEQVADGR